MVPVMKDYTRMVRRRAKEDLHSLMEAITRDNSDRMRSADLETTTGQMESLMLEIGRRTKWTAMESLNGKMVRSTLETLSTIKEKVKVLSFGPMDVNILESGRLESSTESEHTLAKTVRRSKASGPTEEKSDGLMTMATMASKT